MGVTDDLYCTYSSYCKVPVQLHKASSACKADVDVSRELRLQMAAPASSSEYHALHTETAKPGYTRLAAIVLSVAALVIGAATFFWNAAATGPPPSPAAAMPSMPRPTAPPGSRLRMTNGCTKDPLWLANFAFQTPYFDQDIKLPAGETHEFDIPDEGLAATRFWAKWGCDDKGGNCLIGQSGGPGESCPPSGCAPSVDSKFEATFGCMPGSTKPCAVNPSEPSQPLGPIDWWDVSQVDGWTLPYKVEIVGNCPQSPKSIDCSALSLASCPSSEDLGLPDGAETLWLMDPSGKRTDHPVGCYSPCAKLTYAQWGQGHDFTPESKEARHYCCPTPPISPGACSSGPVVTTKYVQAVHKLCPSVYAYAYDDGIGLAQCPSGTRYDVTFYCPDQK